MRTQYTLQIRNGFISAYDTKYEEITFFVKRRNDIFIIIAGKIQRYWDRTRIGYHKKHMWTTVDCDLYSNLYVLRCCEPKQIKKFITKYTMDDTERYGFNLSSYKNDDEYVYRYDDFRVRLSYIINNM